MSILNFLCEADRAVIGTDTTAIADSDCFEVTKIFPLPHADMIVAGRGHHLFANLVFAMVQPAQDFDDAIARCISDVLPAAFDRIFQQVPGIQDRAQQILVCGYSKVAGRFQARTYEGVRGSMSVKSADSLFMPWPWEAQELPITRASSPELMAQLMREQIRRSRGDGSDTGFAHRMLFAELTRGGVTLTTHELTQ